MDGGGDVGVVEWEELEKSKVANVCVSVVAVYRARVCRSRHYRRLHLAGYSHRVASFMARCNKWPSAGESRLRQKRDAKPFLLRRARHFLRRRQQCPSPPRVVSLLACILFTRSGGRDGMPTHRISRAERAWPYRKPSTLFFATAHSLPASPIPFALPSSLPFLSVRPAD